MTSRFKEFHGTSLSEKDFSEGRVLFNHDEMKADYAWDTGVGIGTYLAGLKRGVIVDAQGQRFVNEDAYYGRLGEMARGAGGGIEDIPPVPPPGGGILW